MAQTQHSTGAQVGRCRLQLGCWLALGALGAFACNAEPLRLTANDGLTISGQKVRLETLFGEAQVTITAETFETVGDHMMRFSKATVTLEGPQPLVAAAERVQVEPTAGRLVFEGGVRAVLAFGDREKGAP